jgi:hypothetical protein
MNINSKLQQQLLLNKKLQRLLATSVQQISDVKTSTNSALKAADDALQIADNAIKPTALTSGLASKADLVHTHTLSNLTQSSAAIGQVPQWSGSAWVPTTVSGGSSPSNVDGGSASSIPVVGLTYDGGSA